MDRGRADPLTPPSSRSISGRQARARPAMIGRRYRRGNRFHRFKIAVRSNRETCLDHIHTQAVELVRPAQLFLLVDAATRRLLSVAEGRVENYDRARSALMNLPRTGLPNLTRPSIVPAEEPEKAKLIILYQALVLLVISTSNETSYIH